jgi:hypothetical protein
MNGAGLANDLHLTKRTFAEPATQIGFSNASIEQITYELVLTSINRN